MLLFGVALAWAAQQLWAHTKWEHVHDAPRQARDMAVRMWPPNFGAFDRVLKPLIDTVHIATLGTVFAWLIATPLAVLAARNLTRSPYLRTAARLLIVLGRSVNSLIWALVFTVILGPGMLAGIVAIGLRSVGFIGKLLFEALEEIDPRPVEAITATGATPAQVLVFGVVPQIKPAWLGIGLLRWDINLRESAVVGLVGAGGIGVTLQSAIDELAWRDVALILLLTLSLVVLGEWLSATIRRRVIEPTG